MLLFTPDPVLHVEESAMRSIDTQQIKDLYGLWSAFSKCAGMLENGERLQYLSWRLLNRQTICSPSSRTSLRSVDSVPDLISSPPSRSATASATASKRHFSFDSDDSCPSTSSIDLEGLVHSIQTQQDLSAPLSPLLTHNADNAVRHTHRSQDRSLTPRPASPRPVNTESSTSTVGTTGSFASLQPSSNSSATSALSSHSVVRGFAPGRGISSYTSKSQLANAAPTPILKPSTPVGSVAMPLKRGNKNMFMLGGSSGDDENSFREHMSSTKVRQLVKPLSNRSSSSQKHTSFNEEVVIRETAGNPDDDDSEAVLDTDDEDDLTDNDEDNAIEEDDEDEEWEDDMDDVRDEAREMQFPRVESRVNLPSRRSVLTLMHEAEKSGHLNNSHSSPALRRSRTSTPHGPSMPASPTEHSGFALANAGTQAIAVNSPAFGQDVQPQALSPRTTRRNMLAGELSESLRKQLLWERQQRNQTSQSAMMKRAHTSIDVNRLARQVSQTQPSTAANASAPKNNPPAKRLSWGPVLAFDPEEYHQKGW